MADSKVDQGVKAAESAKKLKEIGAQFKTILASLSRKHRMEMKVLKDAAAAKRLEELKKKISS